MMIIRQACSSLSHAKFEHPCVLNLENNEDGDILIVSALDVPSADAVETTTALNRILGPLAVHGIPVVGITYTPTASRRIRSRNQRALGSYEPRLNRTITISFGPGAPARYSIDPGVIGTLTSWASSVSGAFEHLQYPALSWEDIAPTFRAPEGHPWNCLDLWQSEDPSRLRQRSAVAALLASYRGFLRSSAIVNVATHADSLTGDTDQHRAHSTLYTATTHYVLAA